MKSNTVRFFGFFIVVFLASSILYNSFLNPNSANLNSADPKNPAPNNGSIQRTISSVSLENSCKAFYSPSYRLKKLYSRKGIQIHENTETKRKLAYEFIPPLNPNGYILIFLHGLGDNLYSMQAIIDRAVVVCCDG